MSFRTGGTLSGPVGSGIDCFLMQDNTVLGYSTELNVNEDYMLEGVQSLGYFGFRDLLSLGYRCDMDMGTFLLRGADVAGSVSTPGWQPDGSQNINSSGLYTFTAIDIHTLIVLFTIMGVKYGGGSKVVSVGQLMRHQTRWQGRMVLPGLSVS
jgi:hypothetical protein